MLRLRMIGLWAFLLVLPNFSHTADDIHQAVREGNLSLVKQIIANQPESVFQKNAKGLAFPFLSVKSK